MGNIANPELLVARWTELINDSSLHDVPYKIELNAQGTIEMSPANNWHAATQAYLAWALKNSLPEGVVYTECSVLTEIGIRVPDVAWASKEFAAEQGSNTPFTRVPEICVEIASPSNTKQEIEAKVLAFLAAGAREVWVAQSPGPLAYFGGAGTLERSGYPVAIELPKLGKSG
jgi:Uma2 family endonuclease